MSRGGVMGQDHWADREAALVAARPLYEEEGRTEEVAVIDETLADIRGYRQADAADQQQTLQEDQ